MGMRQENEYSAEIIDYQENQVQAAKSYYITNEYTVNYLGCNL